MEGMIAGVLPGEKQSKLTHVNNPGLAPGGMLR